MRTQQETAGKAWRTGRWVAGVVAALGCSGAWAAGPQGKLLPYDEDYRYLADQPRDGWEKLKYIPAGAGWLSFGGESRTLYDYREHNGFGRGTTDPDGYWQQRLRVWADYHANQYVRVFGELATGFVDNLQTRPVRPTDRDTVDLAQGFVEFSNDSNAPLWRLRAGRQQIAYGWQRVLDPRDPANSRISFDAVRLLVNQPRWSGGLLWGHAVENRTGSFDDRDDADAPVWGAHVEVPLLAAKPKAALLELLYLDSEVPNRRYAGHAPASDTRHTLSARLSGGLQGWDYDLEAIGQRGSYGGLDVRTWQGTLYAGYRFDAAWKPRLGMRLEASSGDRDPQDSTLNTFIAPYPRASVFDGSMFPSNLRSFGPELVLQPTSKLWINTYVLALQRQSLRDGVYGPGGALIQPGDANGERDVGVRKVVWVKYRFNDFASLDVYIHHTSAGAFLRKGATTGRDYFYVGPSLTLRF